MRIRAFTLVEILVVLGILALLAALGVPAIQGIQNKGLDAKSLSNLRQWGIGANLYMSDSNQELPYEGGEENPTWAQLAQPQNERAWFNVVPPYVGMPALKDLTPEQRANLYTPRGGLIFQCPRAKWEGNEASASGPRFSYAFNSKIFSGPSRIMAFQLKDHGGPNMNRRLIGPSTVPMMLGARASRREPKLMPGMNNDVGTALAYTRRASARTGGRVPIVFFDGSVRTFAPSEIMNSNGRNIPTSPVIWNPWNPDEP